MSGNRTETITTGTKWSLKSCLPFRPGFEDFEEIQKLIILIEKSYPSTIGKRKKIK